MRSIHLAWMLFLIYRPVFSQSDSLTDVFPLAINNQWTFGYSYEWGDDPAHNPMWQRSDTGNVTVRIVGKTVTPESTRWSAQETGDHWTRFNGGGWTGPTQRIDSFEIVENHSGNHLIYKTGSLDQVRRSVLPFMPNLVDTAKVYRFARVDTAGISTVRTHEAPMGPIFLFKFQRHVGLFSVWMWDGCTCFPFYSTSHSLRGAIITGTSIYPAMTITEGFRLDQNYPNPFNPETRISYQLPSQSLVTLQVYDMLGREVATLVDEVKQPGSYSVPWNAGDVPSGVYFYRLTVGAYVKTQKMILVK